MGNRKCGDVRDNQEDTTCKTLWLNPAETVLLNLHLPGFILPRGCTLSKKVYLANRGWQYYRNNH